MTSTPTDRYAVVMYCVPTGDHEIYDVWIGENALLYALDQAAHEATPTHRPIVLDVNELIGESGITPEELVALQASAP